MPSTFTPHLNLELQATGENDGVWGQHLNADVITILDNVLGGSSNISLSSSDVTLTIAQSQVNFITFLGALTANVNVIFPAIAHTIFISNATTGNFSVNLRMSDPGSNIIPISQGTSSFFILNTVNIGGAPNVSGPLSAVSGNLPAFSGPSGKRLVDSGVAPPVIASQAQAEAGTSNTVYNTPLRTAQQTTARLASQGQAQAGTDNNTLMTPLRTSQAIQAQATAFPASSADPNLLSFPLGTILTASGSLNRNQACNIYLDASDATAYRITSNGAAMLDGTWLSRGRIGSSILAVRIS